jgi:transcriptional regulator with XRE-family HTH domain
MTTLAARVRELCDAAGTSREKLSSLCGLAASHLGLMVAGRHKSLRGDVAAKIASTTGCSLEWLITGEGVQPNWKAVRERVAAAEQAEEGAA